MHLHCVNMYLQKELRDVRAEGRREGGKGSEIGRNAMGTILRLEGRERGSGECPVVLACS